MSVMTTSEVALECVGLLTALSDDDSAPYSLPHDPKELRRMLCCMAGLAHAALDCIAEHNDEPLDAMRSRLALAYAQDLP